MASVDVANRIVVVMGVCGCGKTTWGEALAARLGLPFLEGDDFHPRANVAKMAGGEPLSDADRWPWLDRFGAALAQNARAHRGVVGACSALRRAYRDRLAEAAGLPVRFLCLTAEREQIAARMQRRKGHFMPVALLDSQFATLELPTVEEQAIVLSSEVPLSETLERAIEYSIA